MLRTYTRSFLAALIVMVNAVLLIVFLGMTGWLDSSAASGPMPTPWPTATVVRAQAPSPTARTVTIHVVKSGEVLADISKRYDVSVQDIVQASGLSDPNAIRAGQPLTIPVPPAR